MSNTIVQYSKDEWTQIVIRAAANSCNLVGEFATELRLEESDASMLIVFAPIVAGEYDAGG